MAPFSSWSEIMARTNRYGRAINSYDWLKFVALVIMTIDHVGAYLVPDDPLWWKAVGRVTFPVWFFLAGYSQSRVLMGEIVWLGAALGVINYFAGYGIFPFNALFSIVICRSIVFYLKDRGWIEKYTYEIFIVCLFFSIFTVPFFEYGTLGVCYAVVGDMVRRGIRGERLIVFTIFSTMLFLGFQMAWFEFNIWQQAVVVIGTCYTVWVLYDFKVTPMEWLPKSGIANDVIRFIARNTMHYYFAHRALFQMIALLLGIRAFNPELLFY